MFKITQKCIEYACHILDVPKEEGTPAHVHQAIQEYQMDALQFVAARENHFKQQEVA